MTNKALEYIGNKFYDAFKHGDSARVNLNEAQIVAGNAAKATKLQPIVVRLNNKKSIELNRGKATLVLHSGDHRLGGIIPRTYKARIKSIFSTKPFATHTPGFHV